MINRYERVNLSEEQSDIVAALAKSTDPLMFMRNGPIDLCFYKHRRLQGTIGLRKDVAHKRTSTSETETPRETATTTRRLAVAHCVALLGTFRTLSSISDRLTFLALQVSSHDSIPFNG